MCTQRLLVIGERLRERHKRPHLSMTYMFPSPLAIRVWAKNMWTSAGNTGWLYKLKQQDKDASANYLGNWIDLGSGQEFGSISSRTCHRDPHLSQGEKSGCGGIPSRKLQRTCGHVFDWQQWGHHQQGNWWSLMDSKDITANHFIEATLKVLGRGPLRDLIRPGKDKSHPVPVGNRRPGDGHITQEHLIPTTAWH